jgi:Siphovirus Gp157
MSTLFQIAGEISALHDLLVECGGELTDAQAEEAIDGWVAETQTSLEQKVNQYVWLIREFEGRSEIRERAAKDLMASAGADCNEAKPLKARLKIFFETCGLSKLETPHFKVAIAANGVALQLVVPPEWEAEPASAPEAFHLRPAGGAALSRRDSQGSSGQVRRG